jgi:hypothetical protein
MTRSDPRRRRADKGHPKRAHRRRYGDTLGFWGLVQAPAAPERDPQIINMADYRNGYELEYEWAA